MLFATVGFELEFFWKYISAPVLYSRSPSTALLIATIIVYVKNTFDSSREKCKILARYFGEKFLNVSNVSSCQRFYDKLFLLVLDKINRIKLRLENFICYREVKEEYKKGNNNERFLLA